ncbi:hypothetical protein ACTS94_05050 [Empedobacter falsenii]
MIKIKHQLLFLDSEFSEPDTIYILDLTINLPFRLNIKDDVGYLIELKDKIYSRIESEELELIEKYNYESGTWEINEQKIMYDEYFEPYIVCYCCFDFNSSKFLD